MQPDHHENGSGVCIIVDGVRSRITRSVATPQKATGSTMDQTFGDEFLFLTDIDDKPIPIGVVRVDGQLYAVDDVHNGNLRQTADGKVLWTDFTVKKISEREFARVFQVPFNGFVVPEYFTESDATFSLAPGEDSGHGEEDSFFTRQDLENV